MQADFNLFFQQEQKQGQVRTPEQKGGLIKDILKSSVNANNIGTQTGSVSFEGLSLNSNQKVTNQNVQKKSNVESSNVGISQREMDRKLAEIAPTVQLVTEKVRPIGNGKVELKLVVDEAVLKQLEELKDLWAHKFPQAGNSEMIAAIIEDVLKRSIRKVAGEKPKVTAAAAVKRCEGSLSPESIGIPSYMVREYIPAASKKALWHRASGQCEAIATVGPFAGRRCTSRRALEIDHVRSVAHGGNNELSNLQLICKLHHAQKTKHEFPDIKIGR